MSCKENHTYLCPVNWYVFARYTTKAADVRANYKKFEFCLSFSLEPVCFIVTGLKALNYA